MLATPVPMKRFSLTLLREDAPQAAMTLARMSVLHPVKGQVEDGAMPEYPAASFHDSYKSLNSRFNKLASFIDQPFASPESLSTVVTVEQLRLMDIQLKLLWTIVSKLEEQLRKQKEKIVATRQLVRSLQQFASLDLDLDRLKRPGRFLKILVGTVPSTNFFKLKQALTIAEYMMESFYTDNASEHVVVVGSSQQQQDVQDVLRSADFRELSIPQEFSGNPAQLRDNLDRQLLEAVAALSRVSQRLSELMRDITPILLRAKSLLVVARPFASMGSVLIGKGGLVSLQGWVPALQQKRIEQRLEQDLKFPFLSQFSEPDIKDYDRVPTLLKHNFFLLPFQRLVSNFGVPGYAEVDPTGLFSISYILMFGMMFGDIGHGAVIAICGLLLGRRYPAVSIVAVLAGLSSMLFGFVYGSLFGFEDVVHALWMSPMHDPEKMLLLALAWGVLFLLVANALAIRNYLAGGQRQQALYSGKGLAGMLFYLAAVFAGYRLMTSGGLAVVELLALLIPMLVMMTYQWRQSEAAWVERSLVVLIESLEQVISSVSGTLSFLRVAAFSLNHIALAAAVFSIAAMMGDVGHWVSIVLGNIFIIVLEGAIVAIQCLRLEYYEGFSRFFSGRGKAFKPLRLDAS